MIYADVDAEIMGHTPLAIRARIDGETVSIPKSLIEDAGESALDALTSGTLAPVVRLSVAAWKVNKEAWR